jgi:hypothetical protein
MLAEALRALKSRGANALENLIETHPGRSILTKSEQLIYGELDPITEVYLLSAGTVRLFVGEGTNARTTLLLEAPALFGDRDVLAGCAVSQEAARSVSKASLLCYERAHLEAAFTDPEIGPWLSADLVRRYARTVRFGGFLSQPLEQRILWLLYERQAIGAHDLPAYEHLASMADSSVKSIGRAIRTLQDDHSMTIDDARRFVVAPETLNELASSELVGLVHRLGQS